jgi:tRNA (guanine-N7-)-methyltransferase
MARKKRDRFAQLKDFSNVLQKDQVVERENWIERHFGNNSPVILELGCGRGEYTLALARFYQNRNIIGVDKKGARLWKGAVLATELGIQNALFLRARIEDLAECVGPGLVEEIWIPFPDPLPKRRQYKNRLVSPPFLEIYRATLKHQGKIHLKTDDDDLVKYLLELLKDYPVVIHENLLDLYAVEAVNPLLSVKTTYEKRHLEEGRTIKYFCFGFLDTGCEVTSR